MVVLDLVEMGSLQCLRALRTYESAGRLTLGGAVSRKAGRPCTTIIRRSSSPSIVQDRKSNDSVVNAWSYFITLDVSPTRQSSGCLGSIPTFPAMGSVAALKPQEKIALIKENLQEVLKSELLEDVIVKQDRPLKIYWGTPLSTSCSSTL